MNNFNQHIERTEKRAIRALKIIRVLKGITIAGSKKLLPSYGTMFRTIIEYGSIVWQTASSTDITPLERVQRKALTLCLGLPSTAGREGIEVAVDILPQNHVAQVQPFSHLTRTVFSLNDQFQDTNPYCWQELIAILIATKYAVISLIFSSSRSHRVFRGRPNIS